MTNPWLSLWLSAANSWSGAARGLWLAEAQRQQTAAMKQMIEQSTRFWLQAWALPTREPKRARRR